MTMLPDWQETRERARAAEHDEQEVAFLLGERERLRSVRDERERRFAAEVRDVDRRERFSIATWIARLVGTHEQEMAQERREEVEAGLRLAQVDGELEELEARLAVLEAGAEGRVRARRAFAEASRRRRDEVVARGGDAARRVEELEARIEARGQRHAALELAHARCREACEALQRARAALDDAFGYGAADVFATGYHATRSAQEGKAVALRRAQTDMRHAVTLLGGLERELEGSGITLPEFRDKSEAAAVTDRWLDSWILDWATLRRISTSRSKLGERLAAVQALEVKLGQVRSAAQVEDERDSRLLERWYDR